MKVEREVFLVCFCCIRSSDLPPPASVCCTGGRDQLGWAEADPGPVSTMFYNVCCQSDIGVTWLSVREL